MRWYCVRLVLIVMIFLCAAGVCAGEIHEAAKNGDLERLTELLDDDPGLLYTMCDQGKTPLHWATGRGQHQAMMLMITSYNADVNVRNINGGTPLHVAASQAQPEGAKILIASGAAVNDKRTKDGATPLHVAALKGRKPGHIETAKILLEHGADPSIAMDNGALPETLAQFRDNTEIIELLRAHGGTGGSRWGRDRSGAGGQTRFGGRRGAGANQSKILKRFDADGNGMLDNDERAAMRATIRSRFAGFRNGETGSSSRTPASRAGSGMPGAGQTGSSFFSRIEETLGTSLSAAQRAEIGRAFQANMEPMAEAKEEFARVVSDLTGVPVEQLREWMPPPYGRNRNYKKDMIPKIEGYIGRSISEGEMETIKQAGQVKNEALYKGKDAIVEAVARITGLPPEEIDALMPKYGAGD